MLSDSSKTIAHTCSVSRLVVIVQYPLTVLIVLSFSYCLFVVLLQATLMPQTENYDLLAGIFIEVSMLLSADRLLLSPTYIQGHSDFALEKSKNSCFV